MSRPGLLSGGEEGDGWKEHLSMLGQIQTKLRRCAIGIGDVVACLDYHAVIVNCIYLYQLCLTPEGYLYPRLVRLERRPQGSVPWYDIVEETPVDYRRAQRSLDTLTWSYFIKSLEEAVSLSQTSGSGDQNPTREEQLWQLYTEAWASARMSDSNLTRPSPRRQRHQRLKQRTKFLKKLLACDLFKKGGRNAEQFQKQLERGENLSCYSFDQLIRMEVILEQLRSPSSYFSGKIDSDMNIPVDPKISYLKEMDDLMTDESTEQIVKKRLSNLYLRGSSLSVLDTTINSVYRGVQNSLPSPCFSTSSSGNESLDTVVECGNYTTPPDNGSPNVHKSSSGMDILGAFISTPYSTARMVAKKSSSDISLYCTATALISPQESPSIRSPLQIPKSGLWIDPKLITFQHPCTGEIATFGCGSFGHVVKAWYLDNNGDINPVAVKVFLPSVLVNDVVREARLMSYLQSEFVPRFFGLVSEEVDGVKRLGIVSECVGDGLTLHKLLQQKPELPIQQWILICRRLAASLEFFHQKEVLYNDFKEDNVLIQSVGKTLEPVLCDFGHASYKSDVKFILSEKEQITHKYLAPEVLSGGSTSRMSDVYSLGRILTHIMEASQFYLCNLDFLLKDCTQVDACERPTAQQIVHRIDELLNMLKFKENEGTT